MAEVSFDGIGTPIIVPNIKGAEFDLFSGLVIFTNVLNPRTSTLGGVGVPVADANRPPSNIVHFDNKGKNVSLGALAASFPDAEVLYDGIGTPVAAGSIPGFVNHFDNRGKNVSYGADNAIFPDVSELTAIGIPVGDGNRPNYPINGFDNKGKKVIVTPQAGPPTGTILWKEVTYTGPVINVGSN